MHLIWADLLSPTQVMVTVLMLMEFLEKKMELYQAWNFERLHTFKKKSIGDTET